MINEQKRPLVSVITLAYNHKDYIRTCLEGILMQKTSFNFELIIHDDASTDGTAEIIREYESKYPDIVKPIYQLENQYSRGVSIGKTFLYPRAKGQYIAECEGDDYWTDPLKLQKQVDIFRADNEVGFVYTAFKLVNKEGAFMQNTYSVNKQLSRSKTGYIFPSLLRNNFPQTLTVMFKKELMCDLNEYYSYSYDWPLFIHICGKSKAVFLKDFTGCYRVNPNGIMASTILKSVDDGGFKTLSGAFKAYLNDEYRVLSMLDKFKVDTYMYYRIAKCNIENYNELTQSIKSRIFFQLIRNILLIWK